MKESEYEDLLLKQEGRCAICKTTDPGKRRNGICDSFAVDHCHKTGEVRGLLCYRCNLALGLLDDNLETIFNTVIYLTKGSK